MTQRHATHESSKFMEQSIYIFISADLYIFIRYGKRREMSVSKVFVRFIIIPSILCGNNKLSFYEKKCLEDWNNPTLLNLRQLKALQKVWISVYIYFILFRTISFQILLGLIVVSPSFLCGLNMSYTTVALPQMNLSLEDASWFGMYFFITT